jgi:hypothetical protein
MADGWWRGYLGRSSPPQFIESDLYAANALARIICRTDASRVAFIEYCCQGALAIIEENKPVVLTLRAGRCQRNGLSSPSALRPFLESPDQGLGA